MVDSNINFLAFARPDIAGQQLQIQRQQALAQQLMDQGSQQDNPAQLANPGGLVIPLNKWGMAAKALEKGAGSYMQGQAMQNQMNMYKQLANPAPSTDPQVANALATGAPMPGQVGPTQQNLPLAQALMNQGQQGSQPASQGNPLSDPRFMQGAMMFGPDAAGKAYFDSLTPTDLMKNAGNPTTAPYVQKDLITTGAGGVPVPVSTVLSHYGATGSPPATAPSRPSPATQPPAPISQTAIPTSPPVETNTAQPTPSEQFPGTKGGDVPLKQPSVAGYDPFNPVANDQKKGMIEGDQKYLNETLLPAKDAAQQANSNLDALKNAAAIANSNDLTRTGPTDPSRVTFLKYLNDFASSVDGKPPVPANELAAADTINKIGLRLTANMTKMLGSREAAQIFTKIQEANPNWYMQPQTLNLVTNLIGAENDTAIGKYNAGYQAAKNGGLAQDGVNAYEANNPGSANVKTAFAASGMAGFANMNDPAFKALPSGSPFYVLDPQSPYYGQRRIKQ